MPKRKATVTKQDGTKTQKVDLDEDISESGCQGGDTKTTSTKGGKSKSKTKKREFELLPPKHEIKKLKSGQEYTKESDLYLIEFIKDEPWREALSDVFTVNYFQQLEDLLASDYENGYEIFPPTELIFNAFNLTPIDKVKVVILGQDPYHDDDQAHGLSFSVPEGLALPPSLKNIYKELATDIPGFEVPSHGCLEKWAREGVFLLNSFLTVQAHYPGSHARYGWQQFTDTVIQKVSELSKGVVFIFWGNFAHKKASLVDEKKHSIIKTFHPSPLSFNKFSGCKCFSQANKMLASYGRSPVDWTL